MIPPITVQSRQGGKFGYMAAQLSDTPGIIVTADEDVHLRLIAALPGRDVRLDANGTHGAVLVFHPENLPLHLYTAAERKRASS